MSNKDQFSNRTAAFKEGIDYYFNEEGLMVLTAAYLRKRGHCCHSDCLHCPYGNEEKGDPSIPPELQMGDSSTGEESGWTDYLDYDPDEDLD